MEAKKFLVLDPAEAGSLKWSVAEFMQRAYTNTAYYDKMSSKQVLQQLIKDELSAYNIKPNGIMQQDETLLLNKLTYFYLPERKLWFCIAGKRRNFLKDLLYNLQLNAVPNEFKSINADEEKLKIKTPVVLTIKKLQAENYNTFTQQKTNTKKKCLCAVVS